MVDDALDSIGEVWLAHLHCMHESTARTPQAPPNDQCEPVAVVASVDTAGRVNVAVRGRSVASAIGREELGTVLSQVVEQHPGPLELLIREADGRDFLGALPSPRRDSVSELPTDLVTLEADGFVPGEEVGIAVIVRLTSASSDGRARGVVAHVQAPGGSGDVLLFGLTSGTIHRGGARY